MPDTKTFIGMIEPEESLPSDFFREDGDLFITRAPGRLDLMGGIADYSGSLVLQLPIAAATHVALQKAADNFIEILSLSPSYGRDVRTFRMSLSDFYSNGYPIDYETAGDRFAQTGDGKWASYVAGAFLVLMREKGFEFNNGARLFIYSDVPEGKGVSSSAALEAATMCAVCAAFGIEIEPRETAFLCQKVENLIAGAPCGVMDQMTSVCGESGRLLSLLCQPGEIMGMIDIPSELSVWGIDSGLRHSVSGSDYGTVRTAAFMGYRIIAEIDGLQCIETETPTHLRVTDAVRTGYLANITPDEFDRSYSQHLPKSINGREFLKRYGGITDFVTMVKPDVDYPVLDSTRHPVYENQRVRQFAEILDTWDGIDGAETMGELMYQSHESYSACGLGSDGTDEIVNLVRRAGKDAGLYGAKITGGGSGGTVAVLGSSDAYNSIVSVISEYAGKTGYEPVIISGSSPGAAAFGHIKLTKW